MQIDLKASVKSAINGQLGIDAYYSENTTELADEKAKGGRYPITNSIAVVGDWKITDRKWWSRGYNLVTNEVDVLYYFRNAPTEQTVDNKLQAALTNNEFSSAEPLTVRVREAEETKKIHDNIFRKRFVVEVLILESVT